MFKNFNFQKFSGTIFLLSLSFCYLLIGFYSISNTGLAGDETAHLAAAHSYIYGQGVNVEHPTLLKNLNAGVLAVFFNDYYTENREQWSRGVDYQLKSKYESSVILQSSRLVYLLFNLGFIFFLWLFTYKYRILNQNFSFILGFLYVFSPSFYSHNFLLTFDVAAGWTAFVVFLATLNLVRDFGQTSNRDFWIKSGWLSLALFLALNVKFSNFIWVAILLAVSVLSGVYFIYKQNDKALMRIAKTFGLVSSSNLVAIWILNLIAFRSEFSWSWRQFWNPFLYPIFAYLRGLVMTLGRSGHQQPNFVEDRFVLIKYHQFIGRVFWFKENPVLIILMVSILAFGVFWVFQKLLTKNRNYSLKNLSEFIKNQPVKISIFVLAASFPFLYFAVSWNSNLTIGYRHFYPVLIYIYAFVALIMSLGLKGKITKILVLFALIIYAGFGIAAIPQGISYTNIFWQKPKWQLITDSTINWDQDQTATFRYLKQKNLFKSSDQNLNPKQSWNTALAVSGGPNTNIALQELIGKGNRLDDFWSPFVDLRKVKISDLNKQYLLVDSNIFQLLSDDSGSIAKQNLDYLQNTKPIFEKNQIIFIFKL
jgi:hypothetical protein